LRRLGTQADSRAAQLLPATFDDVIGEPGANPLGWAVRTFRDILSRPLINGVSPATDGANVDRVLTLAAITGADFDASAVKEGLFARRPDDLKRAKVGKFLTR